MSATITPHYFGSTSFGALAGLPFPAVPAVPAVSGGAGAIQVLNPLGWQWLFSAGPIPSTPARITLHPFRVVQFGALAGLPWPVAASLLFGNFDGVPLRDDGDPFGIDPDQTIGVN